eukprot:GHRR01002242.1.p1 GENE.GHRR01002242.1~~GHRR01002242.1.p1  ORF type:complete len:373 (+),score=165.97 GHRR01002242.1:543-1661(+)
MLSIMEHPSNTLAWQMSQPPGVDPAAMSSYLDFLTEELVGTSRDPLDSGTLAAVTAAQGVDRQRKRLKRENSMPEAADLGSNDDYASDDEDEDPKGKGKRKSSVAAQNKANREKARREKINDRFTELAKLVDPSNEPKTDKLSILGEAIRYVQQTQVENSQLKQLNKFLEEKVGQLEKERAQMLYQMYQFSGSQIMQPPAAAGAAAAGPSMMTPMLMPSLPPAPLQQQVMQQPALGQMLQPSASAAGVRPLPQRQLSVLQQQLGAAGPSSSSTFDAQQHLSLQLTQQLSEQSDDPQQQAHHQQQFVDALNQQGSTSNQPQQLQHQQQQQQFTAGKPVMPAAPSGVPLPYWQTMMPPSMLDSIQDSLLRPPAA